MAKKFTKLGNTDEAFEAGKQAEYEAFWNSALTDFYDGTYAFSGRPWTDATFRPPKKLTLQQNCNGCFYASRMTDIMPYVEFGKVTSLYQAFESSKIKQIPYIDCSNVESLSKSFNSANIESIDGLTVAASTRYSSVFNYATNLKHVIFSGTIGQNGLSLADSTLLDKESITSIINALSATTSGLSVTLSATAVNNAFTTDEWNTLIATKPNWTISLM